MDATATERAVLVGLCGDGVWRAVQFAASNPERVLGIVAFAVGVPLPDATTAVAMWQLREFDDVLPAYEGWAKINRHYWRRDYAGLSSSSSARSSPNRTRRRSSRTPWAGRSTGPSTRWSPTTTRHSRWTSRRSNRSAGPCAARCCSFTAPRTTASRSPAPTAWRSSPAPRCRRRRRRPHDPGPPPGARKPADSRLRPITFGGTSA